MAVRFPTFLGHLVRLVFVACGTASLSAAGPPRLAVVISIDQFRADYLERFRPQFVEGGFRRLLEHGADCENCHYRHAATMTAAGHATILTGVHPDVHGIIANEWLRRDTMAWEVSVADSSAPLVGAVARGGRSPGGVFDEKSGRSPRNLRANTVGDQLKLRNRERSRVISIANKDRAAILLGGRLADGVYWVDGGRFVTSSYYRPELPAWAVAFNGEGRVEKDFGRTWDRLLEKGLYDAVQGPDEVAGEEIRLGLGGTFPRVVNGGRPELSPTYLEAYALTPFYTTLLTEFVKAAVTAEELGRHEAPDLLCIGFSQLDHVGHSFGPDSHEVMDTVVRMDRALADLFAFLDAQIGAENYTVVLTADHGVAPLPERLAAAGRGTLGGGRLDVRALERGCDEALTAAFGAPPENSYWVVRDAYGIRLRAETLRARSVSSADAQRVAKAALLRNPQIAQAFTRDELLALPTDGETVPAMVRRSFFPERSQDVMFVVAPYVVDRAQGSNHGTPYDYDTHVPLLWAGAGITSGPHHETVGVDDLAPTLSALLNVPPPEQARGHRLF